MFNLLFSMLRSIFFAGVVILLFGASGTLAAAQTTSRQGITINPSDITEQLEVGGRKEFDIHLTNAGTESGLLSYRVTDASMNISQDQRAIFTPETTNPIKIIPEWITINGQKNITLLPNQAVTIHGVVQIPAETTIGEYYGLITFRLNPIKTSNISGSTVATEISTKVTLTVGNPKPDAFVKISANPTTSFSGEKINFTVDFKNTGNTSTTPKGRILILDNEQKPSLVLPINPTGVAVIPGTVKSFSIETDEITGLGKEQARLELWYGTGSQKQYTSKMITLYRLPQKKIAYIAGGIGIGVPVIGIIHRKRKQRKASL